MLLDILFTEEKTHIQAHTKSKKKETNKNAHNASKKHKILEILTILSLETKSETIKCLILFNFTKKSNKVNTNTNCNCLNLIIQ